MTPPELALHWVEILINGYSNDADITPMLDSTKIHLVLQANPDGCQVAETNPSVRGSSGSFPSIFFYLAGLENKIKFRKSKKKDGPQPDKGTISITIQFQPRSPPLAPPYVINTLTVAS
jgi:hypothetical protein